MKENQRLRLLMQVLKIRTQKEFAARLKIKEGSLSDILREKKDMKVSDNIKDRLEMYLHVNLVWFETGEGEYFLPGGPIDILDIGVPYYNLDISDSASKSLVILEEKPEYFVNYKPFNDCTAYLPVFGDSMYPKYVSGEIIAVREIINFDVIQWGEAYVVITNEHTNAMRSIKILHEHSDHQKIILKSSNPNFKGETVIKKIDILSLYAIKGKITRNMI